MKKIAYEIITNCINLYLKTSHKNKIGNWKGGLQERSASTSSEPS